MGIPFRAQMPAGPFSPAPTGPMGPRGPAVPNPLGWTPKALNLNKLKAGLLNPRNIRGFGIGGLIASMIAQWAVEQMNMHLALWLNGFSLVRICDPTKGMDTWTTSSTLPACLTGTGAGLPPRALPAYVGSLPGPNYPYIRFLGLNVVTPFGAKFYKESRDYAVVPAGGSGSRPRPHYSPVNTPRFAPPRAGALAPPGFVPIAVKPYPVWAGNPPGVPGVDSGNGLPGGRTGGVSSGVIPGVPSRPEDRPWRWEFPPFAPAKPITAVPIPDVRAPPLPGQREVKVGANTRAGQLFFGLMKAREAVSEMDDFVEVLFRSLPKGTQSRYGDDMGSMILGLYENLDKFDFRLAMRNLIANQLEDEIIGRSYMSMRGSARRAVWGDHMGSLGTVNGPGFEEFAKAVSQAAGDAADAMMGYDPGGPRHRIDRAFRADQEERRKALLNRLKAAGLYKPGKSPSSSPRGQSRPSGSS